MKVVRPTPQGIESAANAIRDGRVVVYPTENMYGLGADPFNERAVRGLFDIKRRPPANPVLVVVSDETQLDTLVEGVSDVAKACMDEFWPGPLSLLLPGKVTLPGILTAGRSKVCVRCPGNATARELCRTVGHAVTSTSANIAGAPPACSISELDLPGLAIAIDGGNIEPGPPSTIYDPDTGKAYREGVVRRERLQSGGFVVR